MKTDKFLYEFKMNKLTEVEETEVSKNEKGEEVKTIKKVKKETPVTFRLVKPNRKLFDEAELFYGIKLSEGIKAGLLTKSLLAKRYQNDGGAMSEPEKEKYATLYLELYRLQSELQRLELNLDNLSKEDKDKKIEELVLQISETKRDLQEIENYHSTLFDQTAENRARNQTIMWWVLNMSFYSENGVDFKSFFGEGDYYKKIDVYDSFEEMEDDFNRRAMLKLAYFISLWYMGRASTFEDFKNMDSALETVKKPSEKAEEPQKNSE
jgi:hypothetical protein